MRTVTKYLFLVVVLALSNCTDQQHFTIYTIGDSTMADKSPDAFPETGWCQVLQNYFDSTVTVSNQAVNGRSTKSFIDEGRWQTVKESLKPGDYVFIQFGHNDEKVNDPKRFTTPFGTYTENLEKFIRETREKGATPILFTPIVRRKFGDNGKLTKTHGDYPDAVRATAGRLKVPLIDLETLTESWVNSLGDVPSKEFYLWTLPDEKYPEGRKDDTHLSLKGANMVAALAMKEAVTKKLAFSGKIHFKEGISPN